MNDDPRAAIFAAIRAAKGPIAPAEVPQIDDLLDRLRIPRVGGAPPAFAQRTVGPAGTALVKEFEGCELAAYPDPGTGGEPWTIGWGATGAGIGPGTVWTQAQADARLAEDLGRFARAVQRAIGTAPTSACQFDALVCFAYNCRGWEKSTLLKLHKAGNFAGARLQFGRWVFADGKWMRGLVRRRAAEATLYGASAGSA